MKKRWIKGIIMFLLCVCILGFGKMYTVQADTTKNMQLNKEYVVNMDRTEQIYKLTIPANGVLDISGSGTEYIGLVLQDGSGNVKMSKDSYEHNGTLSLPSYGVKKGSVVYLKVSSGSTNSTETFKAAFKKTNHWEQQENNTKKQAQTISPKVTYQGNIHAVDDKDYFKFTLKKTSKVIVTIGQSVDDGNTHNWKATLYNSRGKSKRIYSVEYETAKMKKSSFYLKKGTYYIQIASISGNTLEELPYKLSYQVKAAKVKTPTIQSVKLKKGYNIYKPVINVASMKVKGAGSFSGYDIRIAKKANMDKILYKGKVNWNKSKAFSVETNMGKQKKYYIRVRAYMKTPFKEYIYSGFSKTKKAKL